MAKKQTLVTVALALSALTASVAACGSSNEDPITTKPIPQQAPGLTGNDSPGQPGAATPGAAGVDGGAAIDPTTGMAPLPLREFGEKDFTETDSNRDPFRNYSTFFFEQAKTHVSIQRHVLVDSFALDELKLVGVVTRSDPRVLLLPPHGQACIARLGDFVGKAEVVHSGGPTGTDVAINWRVDRIREDDVVFVREDPSHPEIPPTTHVVSLRTSDELAHNLQQP